MKNSLKIDENINDKDLKIGIILSKELING